MRLAAIILTKTSTDEVFGMTLDCAESLVNKANSSIFDISVTVVESEQVPVGVYPSWIRYLAINEPFNFNRFFNVGIEETGAHDWYLLCNNDLLFDDDWLYEIERVIREIPKIKSLSPISPTCREQQRYLSDGAGTRVVYGYARRDQLSGWCLMISHEALTKIGPLDERFRFYFADDDYALCLRRHNIEHALVPRSRVFHLEDRKVSQSQPHKPKDISSTPRYLRKEKYEWIMESEEMLSGFVQFQEKWGDYRVLSGKRTLHDLLFLKLGIGMFSKLLFRHR